MGIIYWFIIYSGWGPLVIVFGIIAGAIGIAADVYLKLHSPLTPYAILAIWALLCFFFGRWVNNSKYDRLLLDQGTNEQVILKERHSLFFIQIEYWVIPILLLAAFYLYRDIRSGKIGLDGFSSLATETQAPAARDSAKSSELAAARDAYEHERYAEAMALYRPAAERGDADAQLNMGLMLARGLGVAEDPAGALAWFEKAAAQGDAAAQAYAGLFYANGSGTARDDRKAFEAFRKSAQAGNPRGQYLLGISYLEGRGTQLSLDDAKRWLTEAVKRGSEDARKALAELKLYPPGRLNIVFTGAEPRNFENGRATDCALLANIHNDTKYHLNKISFKIENWSFAFGEEMNANTYVDGDDILTVLLSNDSICSYQAAYIRGAVSKAAIFDCEMPGVAEGDCQDLVSISSTIDDATVKAIDDLEKSLGAKQTAPIRDALARTGLNTRLNSQIQVTSDRLAKFAGLLNTIVQIDSESWAFNKYVPGSMTNVSVLSQRPDIATIELKGFYTYRTGERLSTGWVVATIQNGNLKCLQYHDFANECRSIRLPDVSTK